MAAVPDVRERCRAMASELRAFDRKTEAENYTDSDEAWQYLKACEKLLSQIARRLA